MSPVSSFLKRVVRDLPVDVLKDVSAWCRLCKRHYSHLLLCQFRGELDLEASIGFNNPFVRLKTIFRTASNELFDNLMSTLQS